MSLHLMNVLFFTVTFLVVKLKVHFNMRTVPCIALHAFEFSFDTVRSTNDSLKQITGTLLICSSCLWFNQLSVPELVQHEQRPQHIQLWARSIQPKFPEISVQNSMDRFGSTGKVSKKRVHLLRWTTFPGRTGWNFG